MCPEILYTNSKVESMYKMIRFEMTSNHVKHEHQTQTCLYLSSMTTTHEIPTQNNWVNGRWLSLVIPMTTMKSECSK